MNLDSTTTNGTIKANNNQISFENIERFEIYGGAYNDSLLGGNGNDNLSGGRSGDDTIKGGAGDDALSGSRSGNSLVDGGTGNDNLSGSYSAYEVGIVITLDTTTTNGTITGGNFVTIFESIESFQINGTFYSDSILGGNGNDSLDGNFDGDDTIKGGAGDDTLYVIIITVTVCSLVGMAMMS